MARESKRNTIQRINRKLAKVGQQLHTTRGEDAYLGEHYVTENGVILTTHVDVGDLADELAS